MRVFLSQSDFGLGYELTPVNKRIAREQERETGSESRLFQSDWDFPRLAEHLGWNMARTKRCDHSSTDGTVTCKECGRTAGWFIDKAREWLDKRVDSVIQRAGLEMYFYND